MRDMYAYYFKQRYWKLHCWKKLIVSKQVESQFTYCIRRFNIVKMAIFQKLFIDIIPIKIPTHFFSEISKLILKFMQKWKESRTVKGLEKKEWCYKIDVSQFQNLLEIYSNQKNAVLGKNRHIEWWNIIESPEIDSQVYSQLIFDKGDKTIR